MEENKDYTTRFNGYSIAQGQLVSDRVQRIVMAIHEYFDGEVQVRWIPDRQARDTNTPQFKIVHVQPGKPEFILFHVVNEEEFDERVLLKLIQNDQRNGQVTLSEYEAWEKTQKAIEQQVYLDMMEEAEDMAAHILATHKNTYKVNDDLTIKEGIPFNASRLKDPKFISHTKKDK
jgi:hypothetical protein